MVVCFPLPAITMLSLLTATTTPVWYV
jgi:hypothetical protein